MAKVGDLLLANCPLNAKCCFLTAVEGTSLICPSFPCGYLLDQSEAPSTGNFRSLRYLLIVDEARKVLRDRRSESLVDLIRKGRSKGVTVMLLSQDPSDFEGEVDDFTRQLGTVVAFACAQTQRGLRNLIGVFSRKVLPEEFSGSQLPRGIAFVKAPGKTPERINCWGDTVEK